MFVSTASQPVKSLKTYSIGALKHKDGLGVGLVAVGVGLAVLAGLELLGGQDLGVEELLVSGRVDNVVADLDVEVGAGVALHKGLADGGGGDGGGRENEGGEALHLGWSFVCCWKRTCVSLLL